MSSSPSPLPSKVVVVTGATHGLGLHCCRTLARRPDTTLVLACRNVIAARLVAGELSALATPERIVVLDEPCDLASLASTRAYCVALRRWLGPRSIDVLINNAGVGGFPGLKLTADGFETIFQTNHLGHFLLTVLLLPALASRGGRIVNVSSEVHDAAANGIPMPDPGETHFPASDENWESSLARGGPVAGESERSSGSRRYTRSKLANVLFTHELARRLSGAAPRGCEATVVAAMAAVAGGASCTLAGARATTVVAFNPGLMLDSNFVVGVAGSFIGAVAWALTPVIRLFSSLARSAEVSGPHLAAIALPDSATPETAAYWDGPSLKNSSAFSRSLSAATLHQQELWRRSIVWAGVTETELRDAGLL